MTNEPIELHCRPTPNGQNRLPDRECLAGDYGIADMACHPRVRPYKNHAAWLKRAGDRPAVAKSVRMGEELRAQRDLSKKKEAQGVLFGQRATS